MIPLEYLLGKKLRNLPAYAGAQIPCADILACQSSFARTQTFFIGELFMFQQNETKSQNFRPQ